MGGGVGGGVLRCPVARATSSASSKYPRETSSRTRSSASSRVTRSSYSRLQGLSVVFKEDVVRILTQDKSVPLRRGERLQQSPP